MNAKNGLLFGLAGVAIGAIVGVMVAPQSGRRTRSLVRDKAVKYSHDVSDYAGSKSRHVANKMKGYAHEIKGTVAGVVSRGESIMTESSSES